MKETDSNIDNRTEEGDYRKEFLLRMYSQLFGEIDNHIAFAWKIIGVQVSAFAILNLVNQDVISFDIATTILIVAAGISLFAIVEANFWYNRNLVIIANIERQFLDKSDLKEIHHYFKEHRKDNEYLDVFRTQILAVVFVGLVMLFVHFNSYVLPSLSLENKFSLIKAVPYLVTIGVAVYLTSHHLKRVADYNDFKEESPGIEV